MKHTTLQNIRFVGIAVLLCFFGMSLSAFAQENVNGKHKVGERVECDANHGTGEYKVGTVLEVLGAGDKSTCCRYQVAFDDDTPFAKKRGWLCAARFTRAIGEKAPAETQNPPKTNTQKTGTSNEAGPAAECPFNKAYGAVSGNAAPSAELFKSVIFGWQKSISNFYDFGLTFLDFKMGKAFKNRVYPGINVRRDVDAAPVGAIIYPVKAKELTCQKDVSITLRAVLEIEYSCFKSTFGEWVCKNGAPNYLERGSIPNK
jgi:hypothetical protein